MLSLTAADPEIVKGEWADDVSTRVKYRFMALDNLYAVTSWKRSVNDIKAVIWLTFAQNIDLSYMSHDLIVAFLCSTVCDLFFLSFLLGRVLVLIVIFVVVSLCYLPSVTTNEWMNNCFQMHTWSYSYYTGKGDILKKIPRPLLLSLNPPQNHNPNLILTLTPAGLGWVSGFGPDRAAF